MNVGNENSKEQTAERVRAFVELNDSDQLDFLRELQKQNRALFDRVLWQSTILSREHPEDRFLGSPELLRLFSDQDDHETHGIRLDEVDRPLARISDYVEGILMSVALISSEKSCFTVQLTEKNAWTPDIRHLLGRHLGLHNQPDAAFQRLLDDLLLFIQTSPRKRHWGELIFDEATQALQMNVDPNTFAARGIILDRDFDVSMTETPQHPNFRPQNED